jgi:hypothetical protein
MRNYFNTGRQFHFLHLHDMKQKRTRTKKGQQDDLRCPAHNGIGDLEIYKISGIIVPGQT